jgi:hypothetical protein
MGRKANQKGKGKKVTPPFPSLPSPFLAYITVNDYF